MAGGQPTLEEIEAQITHLASKYVDKYATKIKSGSVTRKDIKKNMKQFSNDLDDLPYDQFQKSLEQAGNVFSDKEMEFLFYFMATKGYQEDQMEVADINFIIEVLYSGVQQYSSTLFSSGPPPPVPKQTHGNLSSQEGGIFGGGSYEADARASARDMYARPSSGLSTESHSERGGNHAQLPIRPRGNQSSIAGGIFGGAAEVADSQQDRRVSKSNESSISGGIFGRDGPPSAVGRPRVDSNKSSIPGGIFGS